MNKDGFRKPSHICCYKYTMTSQGSHVNDRLLNFIQNIMSRYDCNCSIGYLDYYSPVLTRSECVLQGMGQKLTTIMRVQHWQRKYFMLCSNHFEWADIYVVSTNVFYVHTSAVTTTVCMVRNFQSEFLYSLLCM